MPSMSLKSMIKKKNNSMVQWVKILATKPKDLSLIPW